MLRTSAFVISLALLQACALAGDDPEPAKPDAGMVGGTEDECADQRDNDGDGATDCFDSDCAESPDCVEAVCDDRVDNDGDGPSDCLDRDCDGVGDCEFATELTCDDGIDNDGNGPIDCRDADCGGIGKCEYPAETTCFDDFDNDGDGKTDCEDPDCDGQGGCEAVERTCGDGEDNDLDDLIDCDDPDCDGSGACLVAECPPGSVAVNGVATDTPVTVPDLATATSVISIGDAGLVTRVAVGVTAEHTYAGDMEMTLVGPGGTRVMLADNRYGSSDAYSDTLFADGATESISEATAPFTGAYRPEQPLSGLAGSSTAGDWTLEVEDNISVGGGTLSAFAVYLCHCAEPCAAEESCSDTVDNDDDGATDCQDPGCNGVDSCEFGRELSCGDDVDNDADGLKDCLDPDCDGVGTCEFGVELGCGDDVDNDGDGQTDCDDSDCADVGACLVSECPAGSVAISASATDTPLTVPDQDTATSVVNIATAGLVTRVSASVSAEHNYPADLAFTLIGPDATRVLLSDGNGSGAGAYAGTLFSDGASTPISSASAPFTSAYKPEEPLAGLAGSSTAGAWSMEVVDTVAGDGGSLEEFTVYLCHCEAPCSPETSCNDGVDNDDDTAIDCVDPGCDGVDGCEYGREQSCGDDVDNDGDTDKDCADADCDGVGSCEYGREQNCGDDIDNDADGTADCDDSDCATDLACLLACPDGSVMHVFVADDTPKDIVDVRTITSTIDATAVGTIASVAVGVSATHSWVGDLEVSIEAPDGTSVALASRRGSSSDNFDNTIFHDDAATAIADGTAPFTGPHKPEEPLSALDGKAANGSWVLSVYDAVSSDSGSLTDFRISVCVTP